MEKQIPYQLIAKHLSAESNSEEDATFYRWLAKSDENIKAFEELLEIYHKSGEIDLLNVKKRHSKSTWWQMAAAVLILISSVWVLTKLEKNSIKSISNNTVAPLEVEITNDIKIWLNGYSTISYQDRSDSLFFNVSGEAYFEVNKQDEKTVVVRQNQVQLITSNAHFNINHYRKSEECQLHLSKGSLLMIDEAKEHLTIPLHAGHLASLVNDYGIVSISESTNHNYQAWRTGTFYFHQESLFQIVKTLENSLNLEIQIANKRLSDKRIDGYYEVSDSRQLLEKMIQNESLKTEKNKNQLLIKS